MNVNSIKNYNSPVFRMNESKAQLQQENTQSAAALQAQVSVDEFKQQAEQSQNQPQTHGQAQGQDFRQEGQQAMPQMQDGQGLSQLKTPQLADFKKFKLGQQIMGGALCGVAALGLLSSFSGKKWVRLLFTVPVAGAMAFFGANMLSNAKAMDKIMNLGNNPSGQ